MTMTLFVDASQIFFDLLGYLALLVGGVSAAYYYFSYQPWKVDTNMMKKIEKARLAFAQKIVFSLEFFIVADAMSTILKPTIDELIRLALIVVIRTVLSFFLSRELYTLHHD